MHLVCISPGKKLCCAPDKWRQGAEDSSQSGLASVELPGLRHLVPLERKPGILASGLLHPGTEEVFPKVHDNGNESP